MIKNIKIAFFDVDGTLLPMRQKELSPRTLQALQALQAGGVRLCIATGRPVAYLPRFKGITFDVLLTFNGAYCCAGDKVVYKNPIPQADVLTIIANTTAMGRPVALASLNEIAANGKDDLLMEYFDQANQVLEVSPDFDALAHSEVYQAMTSGTPEEHDRIVAGATGAQVTAWWEHAVDIIPAGGGKGFAVKKILEYYGLSREQALAFGDGANDIEMLQAAGTGVAMGNASERVKQAANYVCPPADEDGIYWFCTENGLI